MKLLSIIETNFLQQQRATLGKSVAPPPLAPPLAVYRLSAFGIYDSLFSDFLIIAFALCLFFSVFN